MPSSAQDGRRGGDDSMARKGSVRAARERLQAAQKAQMQGTPADRPRVIGLPNRPNQLVSQFSVQNTKSHPQQMPTPPSSSESVSAVSPTPQWPLANDADDIIVGGNQPQTRGPAPQRPPRPNYVPAILDSSKPSDLPIQQPPPQTALRPPENVYQDEDFLSPSYATSSSRPLTTSSAASTISSLGSIPDFPVPVAQPLPRRSPNLGPPPSARRGPSSYYSQMSYVSPIAEESETNRSHHGSYASSNVIPSGANGFYFDEEGTPSEEDLPTTSEDGRESRAGDHDDQSGLVRKASLGRRTKPSLTTIKSGDSLRAEDRVTASKKKKGMVAQAAVAAGAAGGAFAAGMGASRELSSGNSSRGSGGPPSGSLGSGTGLLDPSSSSSSESVDSIKKSKGRLGRELKPATPSPRPRSPLAPTDSKVAHSPRDLEKGDMASPTNPLQMPTRQTTLADRVGSRRPPRLNVDAVREAEARGSLTSLPDLIRRATRLAANLDRGRTASRLGTDFLDGADLEKAKAEHDRRSGSLSDILASFPPPGLATPTGDNTPARRISKWPSGLALAESASMQETEHSKSQGRGRRCCGMPLWGFLTLLLVLFLLVAAAVVIPVVLIVLPRIRNYNNAAAPATTQAGQCAASVTCENGGVAVVNPDSSCSCLCTNGFTGSHCATSSDSGCMTIKIAGADNATVGSAIPRLLNDAQNNFSIALDSSLLLSLFSSTNLSCTSENALVTFNGLSSRSIDFNLPLLEILSSTTYSLPPLPTTTPHPEDRQLRRRQKAVTSDGIIYEASVTSGPTATASSASPTMSSTSVATTLPVSSNATALDFARVGVLLVLQESRKLDTAVNAQEVLQTFFESNSNNAKNVSLGSGFNIDLINLKIGLSNGTVVQAIEGNSTKSR
ncbi:hypothetical protein AOQ84DRAFT_227891 [Glonium stellatum]|uniref:EGF-like domain-containing protein n=1 Tax=Glonium stellatum TaxID=574774 RepID=A0A8E2JN22_9PEZI|nr:hypothetical protein AOQ84DRAFT_227891 [Glonium stellatum]